MSFVYFLSSIPGKELEPMLFPFAHLIAHAIEYGVLGFLLTRSFLNSVGSAQWIFAAATAFVIAGLFAASDEYHQTFVPGRNGEIVTVFLDMLFSICGTAVYFLMRQLFLRSKVV